MAGILRAHLGEYLNQHGLTVQQRQVVTQLLACRTPALGCQMSHCANCGTVEVRYHSCGNRHCPQCGGAARAKWLEHMAQRLLPVRYYQVVFTLPDELCELLPLNAEVTYKLLFRSAADTLLEVAADPKHLGARLGFWLVLHTWGQQMQLHPHVHAVVPAGGPSLDGTHWVDCPAEFLLPVKVLSRVFRGKFLEGLRDVVSQGELRRPEGSPATCLTRSWWDHLYCREWVVYSQAPPEGLESRPQAVLAYLARYVSGMAISERRLLAHEHGQVSFRWKDYRTGRTDNVLTLPGAEFVRRFVQHILPPGFARVRAYGLLANQHREQHLARCRNLLAARASPAPVTPPEPPAPRPTPQCPVCGSDQWQLLATPHRPSWWEVRPSLVPPAYPARYLMLPARSPP